MRKWSDALHLLPTCRRISDLNGNESTFPPLSTIRNLKTLSVWCLHIALSWNESMLCVCMTQWILLCRILRSCNLVGELPSYIGEMTGLKVLLVETFLSVSIFFTMECENKNLNILNLFNLCLYRDFLLSCVINWGNFIFICTRLLQ